MCNPFTLGVAAGASGSKVTGTEEHAPSMWGRINQNHSAAVRSIPWGKHGLCSPAAAGVLMMHFA